jgi:hypothetical protein
MRSHRGRSSKEKKPEHKGSGLYRKINRDKSRNSVPRENKKTPRNRAFLVLIECFKKKERAETDC